MSRETLIARGRAAAEAGMVDACTIRHLTGSVTDQDTGVDTPTYATVYAGKCRFQQPAPAGSKTDVGQAQVTLGQLLLQVPMTVVGVQIDDVVTCTASALDPDLVGRTWSVTGLSHKTHSTTRRLELQEVTG